MSGVSIFTRVRTWDQVGGFLLRELVCNWAVTVNGLELTVEFNLSFLYGQELGRRMLDCFDFERELKNLVYFPF